MSIADFERKVPKFMHLLMQDFPVFSVLDAAAVFGNGGHESGGLQPVNEKSPTVPGSRGGWGWFQWTGDRRVAFEAYCRRNGLDVSSDMAQYKWLFLELKGPEKRAIAKTVAAKTLYQKVVAFELGFERAGVKHYDARNEWAERALKAYEASEYFGLETKVPSQGKPVEAGSAPEAPSVPVPVPVPATRPENEENKAVGGPVSKANGGAAGAAAGTAGGATVAGAIVVLMSYQGWLPTEPSAAAAATFLITTTITALPGVIGGWIGAYRAKKNSV